MWILILSAVLVTVEEPVWTIASDGSMVKLELASVESSPFNELGPPQSMEEALLTHHLPEEPESEPLSAEQLTVRGKRLPGPKHWRCTTCQSRSCLMYLGWHLQNTHKVNIYQFSTEKELDLFHDNLHNAPRTTKRKTTSTGPKTKTINQVHMVTTSGCKDGNCRLFRGGLFQRLRRW